MKELTQEAKARFFAQYWGQDAIKDINNSGELCTYPVHPSNMYRFEESHLELTPLSQITDEDAIEVARLMDWETPVAREDMREIRDQLIVKIKHDWVTWVCVDFLRYNGYALPWMGLSVEEMVSAGWIVLKGGKTDE